MKAFLAVVLAAATLIGCGRTNPGASSLDSHASSPAVDRTEAPTGLLKVRSIYDWMPEGFTLNGYRYEKESQLDGRYQFPEPVFGGMLFEIAPLPPDFTSDRLNDVFDALPHDHANLAPEWPRYFTTLEELDPSGGRYLTLPVGTYVLRRLLHAPQIGGYSDPHESGEWRIRGITLVENRVPREARPSDGAVTVEVTEGSDPATANVVRYHFSCYNEPFPTHGGGDLLDLDWPCTPGYASREGMRQGQGVWGITSDLYGWERPLQIGQPWVITFLVLTVPNDFTTTQMVTCRAEDPSLVAVTPTARGCRVEALASSPHGASTNIVATSVADPSKTAVAKVTIFR